MDAEEFRPIAADMQGHWWSFPIPPMALAQYVKDLGDLDAAKVRAAIDTFAAGGADKPPTSGQIRRRVAELELDAPSWDEARTAIVRWRRGAESRRRAVENWSCPLDACDGSMWIPDEGDEKTARRCDCLATYLRTLRGLGELPPLLAEFVDGEHLAFEELKSFLDRGDRTAEAQVRVRFAEFIDRAVTSRTLAGLPDGTDLPRLAAARDEDADRRQRHGELRKFNPTALLPEKAA